MSKKKTTADSGTKKIRRPKINLDILRDLVEEGKNASEIMLEMSIKQIGSLRNAIFTLSQADQAFYTVPGLVNETRLRPFLRVKKTGVNIPLKKLPFQAGDVVKYEVHEDTDGQGVDISLIPTGTASNATPSFYHDETDNADD